MTTTASHPSTEQRIHLAALRLFSRQGYAGTGIRELADEAGLSPASLYNHIGSKEDLLVRIMREGNERLERTAVAAVQGVDRPEVRLALLTQVHVFVHGSFRQECRVIDAEFSETEWRPPPGRTRPARRLRGALGFSPAGTGPAPRCLPSLIFG